LNEHDVRSFAFEDRVEVAQHASRQMIQRLARPHGVQVVVDLQSEDSNERCKEISMLSAGDDNGPKFVWV
jgi:prophage tail gpP-like protein